MHKIFFAACDSKIDLAFKQLMNEPISIALYQIEILEELRKEQNPKNKKHDNSEQFEKWEGD